MYKNNQENAVIYLQKLLNTVSEEHVLISGVFDNGTKAAVLQFKKNNGLENDYSVDKITFDLVFNKSKDAERKYIQNNSANEILFIENVYSPQMQTINMMLFDVLDYYRVHTDIRALPFYYSETESALKALCKICRLDRDGISDFEILNRLKAEHKSIKKIKAKLK